MRILTVIMAFLIVGCCPCKQVPIDYLETDKAKYRELLSRGEINYCEYNELLISAYEIDRNRKFYKKRK